MGSVLLTLLGLFAISLGIDSVLRLPRTSDYGYELGAMITLPIGWGLLRAAYLLWSANSDSKKDLFFDPVTFGGIAVIQLGEAFTLRLWGGTGSGHWLGTGVQGLFFAFAAYSAWRLRGGSGA